MTTLLFSRSPYTMLVASLPMHGALFAAKRPPISRLRLEQRLRALTAKDRETLALLEGVLRWSEAQHATDDAAIVERAGQVMASLESGFLRRLLLRRMELRSVMAALRRRHAGEPPPAPGRPWGLGRFTRRIERNWSLPDFGLSAPFPWIGEAQRLLEAGDSLNLEALLLEQVWHELGRAGAEHHFDFEAVVVYVLRWDIINRWTRHDGAAAAARFEELGSDLLQERASA